MSRIAIVVLACYLRDCNLHKGIFIMHKNFFIICNLLPNDQLRRKVLNYFWSSVSKPVFLNILLESWILRNSLRILAFFLCTELGDPLVLESI